MTASRRAFLATVPAVLCGCAHRAAAAREQGAVKLIAFNNAGVKIGVVMAEKVVKTPEEWKKQLSPSQYSVTRKGSTEFAFSGEYNDFDQPGVYRCICCGNALFSSETKFHSGTGWPSFWAPITKENVHEEADNSFGMRRVEVVCKKCDAHLGHVFDDGPPPTNLRYCINSVALRFAPKDSTETQ